MLDGIDGGNTGVVLLRDGAMRGGDAYFDYQGSYASSNGKWKGELINHEHTPSEAARLLFGGYQVGIILALNELFNVPAEAATGAAILAWLVLSVPCLVSGLALLVNEGLTFRKLEALAEEERELAEKS